MLEIGVLKNFDSGTYKAGVQLAGSLTTYFDDISVAKNIPSSALVIGNYVIVAIPGGNPKDAVVIATWPQGSPGGGAGSFLDLSDTPSSYSGQVGKITRVKATEDGLEFVGPTLLPDLVRKSSFMMIPTVAGWFEVLTGAGNVRQEPMRNLVEITDTNAGSALAYAVAFGFNIGGIYGAINWDKHLYSIFNYAVYKTEADLTRRIQMKRAYSLGSLAEEGLGFQVVNLVMTGESYGTSRGTVSLGNLEWCTGSFSKVIQVVIELDPGVAVNFYINGTLTGSITNTDYIPTGAATGGTGPRLCHSIDRSGTGVSGVASIWLQGKIWQEL